MRQRSTIQSVTRFYVTEADRLRRQRRHHYSSRGRQWIENELAYPVEEVTADAVGDGVGDDLVLVIGQWRPRWDRRMVVAGMTDCPMLIDNTVTCTIVADQGDARLSMAHDVGRSRSAATRNECANARGGAAPKSVCLLASTRSSDLGDGDLRGRGADRQHHSRSGISEITCRIEGAPDPDALREQGRARLDRLLDLAIRWNLPVALHAPHGAAADALDALKQHGVERAVFHWHKAPAAVTRAIVDAGYLVSVTPDLVSRDRDRDLVTGVPLDALLVEAYRSTASSKAQVQPDSPAVPVAKLAPAGRGVMFSFDQRRSSSI
jgi:hypothetical protein